MRRLLRGQLVVVVSCDGRIRAVKKSFNSSLKL